MAAVDYMRQDKGTSTLQRWRGNDSGGKCTPIILPPTETNNEDLKKGLEADDQGCCGARTSVIKRNFETNTQYDVIQMLGKTYIIEDSLKAPEWKIHNDLKEVAAIYA